MILKIGAHKYELLLAENDGGDCGMTDFINSKIFINPKMSQSMKETTLFHEALHACNTTLGEDHTSHALLDSLSDQFYHFLVANDLLNKERLEKILCV